MDTTTMIGLTCWAAGVLIGWFLRALAEGTWRRQTSETFGCAFLGPDGVYQLSPNGKVVRISENMAAANPGPAPSLYESIRVAGREAWRQQTREAIQAYRRKAHTAPREKN